MPELAPSASVPPHRTGRPRDFGGALAALAALLLLNTALGPLGAGRIDYPISDLMTNQLFGLEFVTVLLVVPWTAAAAWLALRSDPRAPLLALRPTTYTLYVFVQYVVGPEYVAASCGIDTHIVMLPTPAGPSPTPIPHPFVGLMFDPNDYLPGKGATVLINGLPRSTVGSAAKGAPHIPMGGPFLKPPSNDGELFMGSSTVSR